MSNFPQRLKAARIRAGLSLRALADKLGNSISHAALSKYEKGEMLPDSPRLLDLSKALGVPMDYFFRPAAVDLGPIEFRRKARLGKKRADQIRETARDFLERYLDLEHILGIEERPDVPAPILVDSPADARAAAAALRQHWQMGLGPVNDLFGLLEEKGIKVLEIEANEHFDGLCATGDAFALVVVNQGFDQVRKRFSVAHELGHLQMRIPEELSGQEAEKLCHAFAGAFLLPPDVLREEIGENRHSIGLDELKALKSNYGISIQAIAAQLAALGVVTASWYKQFNILMSKRGWRKDEPGDYRPQDQLRRFMRLVIRAVNEEIISASRAASLAEMSLADLRKELRPVL